MSGANELLSQCHTTLAALPVTVHPDDTLHTSVGQLRAHIAGVTSLDDVIERQLRSTAQVYQQMDQVTSLLQTCETKSFQSVKGPILVIKVGYVKRVKMNLCSAISRKASALDALLSREQERLQCAPKERSVCSNSSTGSEFQTVGPRQRRSDDRVCYVDTAERSSGAGWLIVDVDWQRRRPE